MSQGPFFDINIAFLSSLCLHEA